MFTQLCEQDFSFLTTMSRSRGTPRKHSAITSLLRHIQVSPVKSLGQNFLHDRNLARSIVDELRLETGDYVVEIGPGLGALTEHLLAAGATVLALEKDGRLASFLRGRYPSPALEVRHVDALKFDVSTLFTRPRVKLIGNLPYYVASELLHRFLEYPSPISLAVLMLQKEVVDRLIARSGTKEYGALTVLMQQHHQIRYLRKVPAEVFIPRPDVDSALVSIEPRQPSDLPAYDKEMLVALVRQGFSQRRKQLGKLLTGQIRNWAEAAAVVAVDPRARAETLALEKWIGLANYASPISRPSAAVEEQETFPVVDESDQFLYAAPRRKAHGDNLRHRAVHILIFNRGGEIFLQKRSRWKDRHPGAWDSSAAGHVFGGGRL